MCVFHLSLLQHSMCTCLNWHLWNTADGKKRQACFQNKEKELKGLKVNYYHHQYRDLSLYGSAKRQAMQKYVYFVIIACKSVTVIVTNMFTVLVVIITYNTLHGSSLFWKLIRAQLVLQCLCVCNDGIYWSTGTCLPLCFVPVCLLYEIEHKCMRDGMWNPWF